MTTRAELSEIVANGENSGVEFKLDDISPNDLAEEIVALANLEGGMILLGVEDDGTIRGTARPDLEEWVMNLCRENLIPPIIPFYERIKLAQDKEVAIVKIPKGPAKPYQTRRGRFFIRVGSTKRLATREELARLLQESGMVHYDLTPVLDTSVKDLDLRLVRDYFKRFRELDVEEYWPHLERILANTEVISKETTAGGLTLAGALIFGQNPSRRLFQSGITAAAFRGNTPDYETLDKKEISGPLIDLTNEVGEIVEPGLIEQAIRFVARNTKVSSTLKGNRRIDRPDYPRETIREAVVNAVAHRDYSIAGSRIRLFIFEDRLEIKSPGRLPNTVDLEKIKEGCSYARNPTLVRFLQNYGYMEKFGLGIPMKIIKRMKEHSGQEPLLEERGEEFCLTLYKG